MSWRENQFTDRMSSQKKMNPVGSEILLIHLEKHRSKALLAPDSCFSFFLFFSEKTKTDSHFERFKLNWSFQVSNSLMCILIIAAPFLTAPHLWGEWLFFFAYSTPFSKPFLAQIFSGWTCEINPIDFGKFSIWRVHVPREDEAVVGQSVPSLLSHGRPSPHWISDKTRADVRWHTAP